MPSCLVNPRAGKELDWVVGRTDRPRRIAVVSSGAAGMNFAFNAAERDHRVTLFEAGSALGGQLRLVRNIPMKTSSCA